MAAGSPKLLPVLFLSLLLPFTASAQTTRYIYDDNGRLRAVVSQNGQANIYDYDPAGNFTAVRQVAANHLELFSFSPRQGVPGDQVTFLGVGFGAGVSSVVFNGVPAQILSFDSTRVVAVVPGGATTGPVTLNTANGSVTTAQPFLIQGVLLTPTSVAVLPGQTVQFTATVFTLDPDTTVIWSVNNVPGGNTTIGTITPSGFYTAPAVPSSVTVRAASNSDPSLFAEAAVTLRSINGLRHPVSSSVLVRRGADPAPEDPENGAVSSAVLVNRVSGSTPEVNEYAPVSRGVLVERSASTTPATERYGVAGVGVLVNRPVPSQDDQDARGATSSAVLVNRSSSAAAVSTGILVQRDLASPSTDGPSSAVSTGVLVSRPATTAGDPDSLAAISSGVLVNKPVTVVTEEDAFGVVGSAVLINRPVSQTQPPNTFAPLSAGVLVRRETPTAPEADSIFVGSSGVLVMNGPIITGITPASLSRGTTSTITITGVNLTGASVVRFVSPTAGVDDLIVVSNLSVSADGTSVTAVVQVLPTAVVGNRLVVLQTNRGGSLVTNPNANVVAIQ